VGGVLGVAVAVLALSGPARDVSSSDAPRDTTAIVSDAPGEVSGRCGQPGGLGESRGRVAVHESSWRAQLIDAIAAAVARLIERVRFPGRVDRIPAVTGTVGDCRGEAATDAAAELIRGD
jgi:hypothetical protein